MTNAQTVRHIQQMVNEGGGYLTKDGERMLERMSHEPMQSNCSKVDTVKLDAHAYTDSVTTSGEVEKMLK